MARRKTDAEFRAEVKALVGDQYQVLGIYQGCEKDIKFRHKKCGNTFEMWPTRFIRGSRCPKCMRKKANYKLTKSNMQFKAEVKALAGNEYVMLDSYQGCRTKIRFRHEKCGLVFEMMPNEFLNGSRCPKCWRKRLRKTNDEFKLEVSNLTNDEYTVLSKYKGSQTKVKFKHKTCGFVFKTKPNNFLNGSRCPNCHMSRGEKAVKDYLLAKRILFKTQFAISDCRDKKPLPFDFAVFNKDRTLNCLIEYQGEQHFYDPFSLQLFKNKIFKSGSVLSTQKHDAMKLQYCKEHGIKLIRINHPQTSNRSHSVEFIKRLVNRTLNKELKVS